MAYTYYVATARKQRTASIISQNVQLAISVCSFVGRDAHGLQRGLGEGGGWSPLSGKGAPGRRSMVRTVNGYLVLCSRFPVLLCSRCSLAEHSNTSSMTLRLRRPRTARPVYIRTPRRAAPMARAAPICDSPNDRHHPVIHLPPGFRDSLTFLPNRSLRLRQTRSTERRAMRESNGNWHRRSFRFDETGFLSFLLPKLSIVNDDRV